MKKTRYFVFTVVSEGFREAFETMSEGFPTEAEAKEKNIQLTKDAMSLIPGTYWISFQCVIEAPDGDAAKLQFDKLRRLAKAN